MPPNVPKKIGRPSFESLARAEGITVEEYKARKAQAEKTEANEAFAGDAPSASRAIATPTPDVHTDARKRANPTALPGKVSTRTVPEDAGEADKVLRRYRVPASMVVNTVDRFYDYAEVKHLAPDEKGQGETAVASVLYEEGINFSGRLLLLLWVITTTLPRLIEFFDNRKKRLEAEKNTPKIPSVNP